MNGPTIFTVILRHPEAVPAILTGCTLNDITAIALSASPIKSVEAFPAQARDTRPDIHARDIEDYATQGILANWRPGGFDVEFLGAGEVPKWADEVIRMLDYTKRAERQAKRAAAEAERVAAIAAAAPHDTARKADAARERVRGLVLPHPECKELFELEQRARLVGA